MSQYIGLMKKKKSKIPGEPRYFVVPETNHSIPIIYKEIMNEPDLFFVKHSLDMRGGELSISHSFVMFCDESKADEFLDFMNSRILAYTLSSK